MKISLQSLSRWVDVGHDVPMLAHTLTMTGLEIEGQAVAAPAMSGIVVAEVLATSKHPDAEKLSVCRVNDGKQEVQIICGASNVRAGIKVPLARIGATLPGGMEIKQAKLRGMDSFGMLCSAKELGLAEESQGLLELPTDVLVGQDLVTALSLDDVVFDINLTPNRGDCMSVLGVAREVSAQQGTLLAMPAQPPIPATHAQVLPVTIASEGCGKFVSRVIKGINPGARSPWWLQERLRRAGVRSINAIVDITNHVMLELGQPMHAYDLHKLQDGIVVRQAFANEQVTLLDGKIITLSSDVLVIADQHRTLALAGVMGGLDSAISDTTTDVLLEVAYFNPDAIAGRGRRYGLVTDASQRFERGVDFNLQERAIELATQLVLTIAGGEAGPVQVTGSTRPARQPIKLRHTRICRVLGHDIPASEVTRILNSLGMQEIDAAADATVWNVVPPSWRFDLSIEEDLIEEVARIYGYDRIPATPETAIQRLHNISETQIPARRCALLLVDRGYQEAITYSFTDPVIQQAMFANAPALTLANPISAELAVMRLSLWPGLLQALQHNQKRQQPRIRLFETGRQFSADGKQETGVIAGIAGGLLAPKQWGTATTVIDFHDVKADVEALLTLTGRFGEFSFVAASHSALHPGQSARILCNGQPVGWLGRLNPSLVKSLDLMYSAIVFELEIESRFDSQLPEYKEISRFPVVRRDLALLVAESTPFSELAAAVRESAGPLLHDFSIFDVYHGADLDKGKKSIALGVYLQDTSRTLTDAEVDTVIIRVIGHLAQRLDARLRDK
ncbi:MAG: phenylalanine--tRNA ligase subunit beta [Steroidobacteraceae bacterium]